MQAFSKPNDVLPGSIRASEKIVNVERQLPATQPNNGGQPQMGMEHANIGDDERPIVERHKQQPQCRT
ncbi:hypothetical protein ACOSQ3_006950 [Xanthoceras sorbifolium]